MVHRLGFVPRAQLTAAEGKLRELRQRVDASNRKREQTATGAEQRLKAAEEKIGNLRLRLEAASRDLEKAAAACKRTDEASRHEAARLDAKLAKVTADHERRLAKNTEGHAKQVSDLEEQVRERDAKLEAALREGASMEARVAAATHDLEIAREYLMGIEVKLDILEGAANVLDARLRTLRPPALAPASAGAGRP
jgi:chromosome segregation ATPase